MYCTAIFVMIYLNHFTVLRRVLMPPLEPQPVLGSSPPLS